MWWLEDTKCSVHESDLYLEFDKFKNICHELNVQCSEVLLDVYEKHGLLYPRYRINKPIDYLQKIFEQNYGPARFRNVIEIPDEYETLFEFENEELKGWLHPAFTGFNAALHGGHPLDQAFNRNDFFIVRPSKDTYSSWAAYKVTLEMSSDDGPLKKTEATARHFYSPWQIYLLEEANRRHTRYINILINLGEGEAYILREQPQKLKLTEWQDYFKSLWDYRFKRNLLFAKALEGVGDNILEGKDSENFHNDCEKIAIQICLRYPYKAWREFLRSLCALFFDYQDREKIKLSKCLKEEIRSVIDLLMLGLRKTYREIINDVGTVLDGRSFFYVPPLERIYPEYDSFVKREAKPLLESVLEVYNKEVSDELKLDKTNVIDSIIDYAFNSGNETMLVSVIAINQEYFSRSYFGDEGLWSHIRSLAVAIESWVKTLTASTNLRCAIGTLTKKGLGKNYFDSYCDQLQKELSRSNIEVYSFADLEQFLDKLAAIDFHDMSWMKYLIRAYLTRNYAVHHTKLGTELFGRKLIALYRSLLFLAFFTWKVK